MTLQEAWNELQAVPSYVETQAAQFAQEPEIIPVIPMEDPLIHTDETPFCSDWMCPCKSDMNLIIEQIYQPVAAGLLIGDEAERLYNGKQL